MENTNTEFLNKDLISRMNETVQTYYTITNEIIDFCRELEQEAEQITSNQIKDVEDIDANVNDALLRIEETAQKEKELENLNTAKLNKEIANYEAILSKLGSDTEERKAGLANLRIAIETAQKAKIKEIDQLLQINKEQLESAPREAKEQLLEKFEIKKQEVLSELKERIADLGIQENTLFNQYYETAFDSELLHQIKVIDKQPLPYLNIGSSIYDPHLFGESQPILLYHFIPFFHKKNILLKYKLNYFEKSVELINNLIGRSLMSFKPGKVELHLIDPINRGMNFRKYSKLPSAIKTIYTKEKEIDKLFKELDEIITENFQNFLLDDHENLADYNLSNKKEEPYRLVIIMNYPEKLSKRSIKRLKGVIKNGPIAGINTIIICDKDIVDEHLPDKWNALTGFESYYNILDLEDFSISNSINTGPVDFSTQDQIDIDKIIEHINVELEGQKDIDG